ncbi:dihydroneopterin aldolase [Pedobacter sp. SYSU D00535]|uniref:dihydroneopterin aldolase n=1 Tax=Pedobacter sp. SYSU D00535 TaxID=2810308 RepID=UPI001A95D24D|nr:dihydroneopterin aldolase [Pedobacter sp. SYSU D00535]
MAITQKVALEGIRFFAYHGFYPEEQLTGNEFLVDISTETTVHSDGADEIENTVNYERLFAIASAEMESPKKLLETVAHAILNKVKDEFPQVGQVEVSIRKLRLPVKGEIKNSLIQLTYKRS